MKEELKIHLEKALIQYTSGSYYKRLIEAKNEYFNLTGQVNEDDEDYELRMKSFNDWYIFQFTSKSSEKTVISDYILENSLNKGIDSCFQKLNYSLFEYCGKTFRGHSYFKDILHSCKFNLSKEGNLPGLLKDDLFIGRSLRLDENVYLLPGLCILPREVKGVLKKESKKVRKLQDLKKETAFLLKVESLKTKWVRYGHIKPDKIFSFDG
jgi:hypothetical protein